MPQIESRDAHDVRWRRAHRSAGHVAAQAALETLIGGVHAFEAVLTKLTPKSKRAHIGEVCATARGMLQQLVLRELWDALDGDVPEGDPWKVEVYDEQRKTWEERR